MGYFPFLSVIYLLKTPRKNGQPVTMTILHILIVMLKCHFSAKRMKSGSLRE